MTNKCKKTKIIDETYRKIFSELKHDIRKVLVLIEQRKDDIRYAAKKRFPEKFTRYTD